jgi:hypothetical protein
MAGSAPTLAGEGLANGGTARCSSHEAVFQYVFQLVFQYKCIVL